MLKNALINLSRKYANINNQRELILFGNTIIVYRNNDEIREEHRYPTSWDAEKEFDRLIAIAQIE
jgi:hypothetical protein